MIVYNTLTKKKEEFFPINPPKVTVYMCGPTVYDYFHIGNARSFIMADMIRRYLDYKGYEVKFIMNITDVDDKIIKLANKEGVDSSVVANKYADAFLEDLGKLKVKKASYNPRATEHIDEMIKLIERIESNGGAYNVDGNVFFDIAKFKDYGKLSGKKIDELEAGSRIDVNEEKHNPLDFSLWKKAKEGEPYWESPWGNGRPGWHIECSAMSHKHLGDTIDIHMGGSDLVFPHHENEIAQSEMAYSNKFVKYWIHFGFLNIQNEKMSKSLGNFFTAREVLNKYPAEAIRVFFAQSHYRNPLNFSDELLDAAAKGLEKFEHITERIEEGLQSATGKGIEPEFDFSNYYKEFETAMDDDFNSPRGVAVIFDFIRDANKVISNNENISAEFFNQLKKFISDTAIDVFGIWNFDKNNNVSVDADQEDLIKSLIDQRLCAKENKDYALADEIRNKLSEMGVVLKDGKNGTTYKIEKK